MGPWDVAIDLLKAKPSRGERAAARDATARASVPGAAPQFVSSPGDGPVRPSFKKKFAAAQQASDKVKGEQLDAATKDLSWVSSEEGGLPTQARFKKMKAADLAKEKTAKATAKATRMADKEEARLTKLTGRPAIRVGNKVTAREAEPTRVIGGVSGFDGPGLFSKKGAPYKAYSTVRDFVAKHATEGGQRKQRMKRAAEAWADRAGVYRERRDKAYTEGVKGFKPDSKTLLLLSEWKDLPRGRRKAFAKDLKQGPSNRGPEMSSPEYKKSRDKFDNPGFIKLLRSKGIIKDPSKKKTRRGKKKTKGLRDNEGNVMQDAYL